MSFETCSKIKATLFIIMLGVAEARQVEVRTSMDDMMAHQNSKDLETSLVDKMANKMADKMVDKFFSLTPKPLHQEDLDRMTLGKSSAIANPLSRLASHSATFSVPRSQVPVIHSQFRHLFPASRSQLPFARYPITVAHADASARPASTSQVEDLVINAKELVFTPLGPRRAAQPLSPESVFKNTLSGFLVSMAMIPEAVAFAFVAGVSPITGLQTTAILGFFAAAFGGRGGITTGASGACAVVVASLVASHGTAYLSAAVLLAGLFQIALGLLHAGKFIRLVPHPVMLGFVNGLAIVMTKAQLNQFKVPFAAGVLSPQAITMVGLTALTMVLVKTIPKITRAVPASLAAVSILTALSSALKLPATTLIDIAGPEAFAGGWAVVPKLGIPAFAALTTDPLSMLQVVAPYALTMATVGLVESLLTLQLVDGIVDDGTRGSTQQECVGQGLGNFMSGLTSGMGGCALIGQSLINVQSGGTSRLSAIAMSIFLGGGLIFAAPLIGQVPVATLVGVMLLVCHSTFSWSSLRLIGKIPKIDLLVIALVSLVTVFRDLAQAVGAGVLVSAVAFAWKQSTSVKVVRSMGADPAPSSTGASRKRSLFYKSGWRTYTVEGPLFFGSIAQFASSFTPKDDSKDVVIDFLNSRVMDHSALEAINTLAARYGSLGKRVHLRHLSSDCYGLLERLNGDKKLYEIFEADPATDPVYEVAEDSEYYKTVPAPKPPSYIYQGPPTEKN